MIKINVSPEKDIFEIVDKREGYGNSKYSLMNIALLRFEFFDETETEGSIVIYLKTEIEKYNSGFQQFHDRYPDLPVTMDEIVEHKEGVLEACFSYDNQIDLSGESDIEFDLHELFIDLIAVCAKYKIEVITPDPENSLATRYYEWLRQEEAVEWWRDDFIFRHIFSRN